MRHESKRVDAEQRRGDATLGALSAPYVEKFARVGAKVDCAFQLSVITDELTQDFGHALEVAAKEFQLGFVEVRELWNKNIVNLDEKEVAEVKRLLTQYDLKVTDIASPLFKVDWPGAPTSKYSPKGDSYNASFSFAQQDEVLERAAAMARALGTNKVRLFDFWRLEDVRPYRNDIDQKLRDISEKAAQKNILLVLENEYECNTATSAECARTLAAVANKNFFLNWDPGNAAKLGDKVFPEGYAMLPKNRIGHMHLKDVKRNTDGTYDWECMGRGTIDYEGQFRAMLRDGYHGTMSLETHWHGAKDIEESSRQSMAGTKELLRKAGALK